MESLGHNQCPDENYKRQEISKHSYLSNDYYKSPFAWFLTNCLHTFSLSLHFPDGTVAALWAITITVNKAYYVHTYNL